MPDVSIPNYGLLSGLAEGLKQGLLTYQTTKNIQHQNQMQEMMTGYQRNPDTGALEPTANKQLSMQADQMKNKELIDSHDPNSPTAVKLGAARGGLLHAANKSLDPNMFKDMSEYEQEKLEGLSKPEISGSYGMLGKMFNPIAQIKGDQLDFQKHSTATKSVSDDRSTQKLLDGYQSMKNALVEFKNNPSPQSFHTLQSVARMNAGSNNRSGVSERADQYATDLGIRKDEALQMMTGNMADVNLSSPDMVNAVMKVMEGELGQKQAQAAQQIGKKKKGFLSVYNKPTMQDFKGDFDNVVNDQYSQFDLQPDGKVAAPTGELDDAAKLRRLQQLKAMAGVK